MQPVPVVRHLDEVEEITWSDHRGRISFRTGIGDGTVPSADLCSGVARLEPGGWLALHRHAAPEVYQVLSGTGVVTLDGQQHEVGAGSAVYIPGNREHGIRNSGDGPLEFVYVYQTDSITDVDYVWSPAG